MRDIAGLIENTFAATSPYHMGTVRRLAGEVQRILQRAAGYFGALADYDQHDPSDIEALGQMTETAIASCQKAAQDLSRLLANAEREVEALQSAFVSLSLC